MVKKPTLHPYSDLQAFERLMLLIATMLKYPGVGTPEIIENNTEPHHDALSQVKPYLRNLAVDCGIDLPPGYPSTPTLRKDLETLRRYGILDNRMYRWGYYLGTGAMSQDELKVALNALASQAKYQGHALSRQIYQTLSKRLRGLDVELKGEFFYPVRQHLNRAIIYTDPEEMAALGQNRDTLFHQLETLENAIIQGQAIEISRGSDPYANKGVGPIQVVPIQLIYQDIAWYLLYEYSENGHFAIGRLNRFKDYCRVLDSSARGVEAQKNSLAQAYQLLENGWGLYLGTLQEQKLELQGQLEFVTVKVRFFPPVTTFIQEGELRHRKQKIVVGPKDKTTGKPHHVDYIVALPPRSLDEFGIWVHRYMDKAQIMSPPQLLEKHRQAAQNLVLRYLDSTKTLF